MQSAYRRQIKELQEDMRKTSKAHKREANRMNRELKKAERQREADKKKLLFYAKS